MIRPSDRAGGVSMPGNKLFKLLILVRSSCGAKVGLEDPRYLTLLMCLPLGLLQRCGMPSAGCGPHRDFLSAVEGNFRPILPMQNNAEINQRNSFA
jgi:hypothetical protein